MTPRIETSSEKKLIGIRLSMSLSNFKVAELWKTFMPKRKEIINNINNDLISMVVYPTNHFLDFKTTNEFERWATVEVANFDLIPPDMEKFVLPGGLYAVFDYKGSSEVSYIYQYIYGIWIPNSEYVLDARPHFEVLGEKYKNNDPTSEEEIWIPVKLK
ncbi:MAG: GyrI-like domain-containing protein [Bacteroidetes bacterium]|nr:GyrI-like domain-containing protein [Bacteroidota bacterium]